jgi:hypothetical protein
VLKKYDKEVDAKSKELAFINAVVARHLDTVKFLCSKCDKKDLENWSFQNKLVVCRYAMRAFHFSILGFLLKNSDKTTRKGLIKKLSMDGWKFLRNYLRIA